MNMDGLHLVSPSFINSSKTHRKKLLKGSRHDVIYSVKSISSRSLPRLNGRYQSKNKTLGNKVTKSNSSSQSSVNSNMSSVSLPRKLNSFRSPTLFIENLKIDKAVKRTSKRKAKKKGKQKKKLANDMISSSTDAFFTDIAHSSLSSETCVNNNTVLGDGLVLYATSTEDLCLDDRGSLTNIACTNNNISNFFESTTTCVSIMDEMDVSEDRVCPMVDNSSGECSGVNSKITSQMEEKEFSFIGKEVEQPHRSLICSNDANHLNGFSVPHDAQGVDTLSISSVYGNSSSTTSYDSKACDVNGISPPKLPNFCSKKVHRNSFDNVVDICKYSEGTRLVNQNFNGGAMEVAASGKGSKRNKSVPQNSRNSGNLHGRMGKENNHSVWQKVRKNDDGINSQFEKVKPVCSHHTHVSLKNAYFLRNNSNITKVYTLAKASNKKQLKDKVKGKLKRKTNPGSKKECTSYSWRGSYPSKAKSHSRPKIGSRPNELTDNRSRISQVGCPEMGSQNSECELVNLESFHSSQDSQGNHESVESAHEQQSSMHRSCCSLEKINSAAVRSLVYLPHLIVNEAAQMEKESLMEYCKENHSSGSILQKWIPIGTRDPGNTSARCDILSLGHSDRQGTDDWTLRNKVSKKAVSDCQSVVSSLSVVMMRADLHSEISSSQEDEKDTQKLKNNHSQFGESRNKHDAFNCLTGKSREENFSAVEHGLNNIVEAVRGTCKMRLASEAIFGATGRPLAEFERLIHCCSPAIFHTTSILRCVNCSLRQVVGASLCRHETPNIPLGCLWQWYEKHGSYGLEIRAEEYGQSKRLGIDRFSFRAYFVPFLSAVQLFRNRKSYPINNVSEGTITGMLEACKTGETSKNSSNVANLPIYSLLVPHPRTSDTTFEEVPKSEISSASISEDSSVPSSDKTCSSDLELLYEYFELDPPQQRRPLYEKIQELVTTDDGPSQGKSYGDPTNLSSINLHDLHPGSWYSVAWYPIYRIPDGHLRAAFLTYHSLGHMIHKSGNFDSSNTETCVVSPVVGLQSYNAQNECWFQLRQSTLGQTAESPEISPCGVLNERLRSLEETASLMARAVVNKGNQTSINRHPDYEFFLSRQRY